MAKPHAPKEHGIKVNLTVAATVLWHLHLNHGSKCLTETRSSFYMVKGSGPDLPSKSYVLAKNNLGNLDQSWNSSSLLVPVTRTLIKLELSGLLGSWDAYATVTSISNLDEEFSEKENRLHVFDLVIETFATTLAYSSLSKDSKGKDTFFAEENVSWSLLGLSDIMSRALTNIGLNRPSLVQASYIPSMLSRKDVTIAAEIGICKAYSYLVRLIAKLWEEVYEQEASTPRKILLVLCPNKKLCEQIVRMANSLGRDDGETIVSVAAVCDRQGWTIRKLDIIVTTPVALLNYVDLDRTCRMEFMRVVLLVGRIAKASQFGLVTSMYIELNKEFVDAVRHARGSGQPVETAFSRKRSFRNKLKERGTNKARRKGLSLAKEAGFLAPGKAWPSPGGGGGF
ncbi:hypothetical protein VNO77_08622 [Canavalia gladiata]|uniref:ATP-dependent RNA helicase n=1 Tax=Canavalia gladiata TaxID=3824 RepID=A0AAN9QTV1_CANGL